MIERLREIKGTKLEEYGEISIYEGFPQFFYEVKLAKFSEEENIIYDALRAAIIGTRSTDEIMMKYPKLFSKEFMNNFKEKIIRPITYADALSKLLGPAEFDALRISLIALFKQYLKQVKSSAALSNRILDDAIGYGMIAPLMRDRFLEEIMINGHNRPIFVFHKTFGMCKTNLSVTNEKYVNSLILKIANTADKNFGMANPLLDARLLGGNRTNATYPLVTPFGPTLTIRKFTRIPLSVIDLIANNTLTHELAAFLWVMVEGLNIEPMNIIITGGAGSGKTTTLNVLSTFIRYQDRIVTIEDTLELHLGSRQNWIQMESKPKTKDAPEVTMDDLLKNSLRMRPDRIIVGEVRGAEAQTLFVAMDTGHQGSMGTLHSNSSKEMLLRLKAEPMGVPEAMIPLLDLMVVQYRMYVRGKGILRRIAQVAEVTQMEGKPLISNVYEWDRSEDIIKRSDVPSHTLDVLASKTMKSKKEIIKEINVRKRILEWMMMNNIRSNPEVETIIQRYYYEPETILEKVVFDMESAKRASK